MSHPNTFRGLVFWASLAVCDPSAGAGADAALGNARVAIQGGRISVSTGSQDASRVIRLKFLAGKTIAIEDLRSGGKRSVKVGEYGGVPFEIPKHADYAFLRYEVR